MESGKSILDLMDGLGESVVRLNRMLDNRCEDCGAAPVLITRCRECTERFRVLHEGAAVWPKEIA